jgi:hypothetical protein
VLIALDEVTTGLRGPDGAAVVYYGVPQPSTWCLFIDGRVKK